MRNISLQLQENCIVKVSFITAIRALIGIEVQKLLLQWKIAKPYMPRAKFLNQKKLKTLNR